MSWRVARSLDVLLAEVNAAAPARSKVSDGSIGDAAHASRTSDHNPWVTDSRGMGVVRARAFTHDPADGCDAGEIAEHVRQLGIDGHPALGPGAYVIWNHRIASDSYGWVWRPYSGANPHTAHVHISVATGAAGYDSTAPWGWKAEDDMRPEDFAQIRTIVREEVGRAIEKSSKQAGGIRARLARITKRLGKKES